jgi:hypothetical protein
MGTRPPAPSERRGGLHVEALEAALDPQEVRHAAILTAATAAREFRRAGIRLATMQIDERSDASGRRIERELEATAR